MNTRSQTDVAAATDNDDVGHASKLPDNNVFVGKTAENGDLDTTPGTCVIKYLLFPLYITQL